MAAPGLTLILNELSFSPEPTSIHVGRQWMQRLQETAANAIERGFRPALLATESFPSMPLGPGYSFSHWIEDPEVELEVRQVVAGWFTWAPFVDDLYIQECGDQVEVICDEKLGVGLGLAFVRDHTVLSVAAPWPPAEGQPVVQTGPWDGEDDEIRVLVRRRLMPEQPMEEMESAVRNLHCPASVERRLRWIAARCCVKPRYENPGTHDPTSGVFRGGGTMTTLLPADAADVYETAIPADPKDGLSSWWGQNADKYLYRYEASWPGAEPIAHWNGTTSPASARAIEDREVPASIREAFPDRRR